MLQKKFILTNKLGLHARAAAKLVAVATHFQSEIFLIRNNKRVNGKSIMGVMLLAANQGTEVTIEVSGDDEAAALDALTLLVNDKFGEKE